MTIIDQRILIPASPDVVWEHLQDISHNPDWQIDCRSISFLSSRREGPGVRWRSSTISGRDHVLETTAWYDKLGYEYTIVDGTGYKEARGRIRLQEIPEGTVVQWTFTYEIGGLIGGLRNSLGVKRSLENTMAESLRTLWRVVNEKRDRSQVHEAKSLMRDAPDYEARAQYKPRHPSAYTGPEPQDEDIFKPKASTGTPPPMRPVTIPEPPVADEDTRPSPAVKEEPLPAPEPPDLTKVSSFRPVIEEPPINQDEDVMPMPPVEAGPPPVETPEKPRPQDEAATAIYEDRFKPPPVPAFDEPQPATQPDAPPPILIEEAEAEPEPAAEIAEESPPPTVLPEPAPPQEPEPVRATQESGKLDTGTVSIWEVFGVPRPSETQEIASVKIEELVPEPPAAPVVMPAPQPVRPITTPMLKPRTGLRIRLRARHVRLRHR